MNSKQILSFFDEITQIPRESGHEELIVSFLQDFAKKNNLECKTDESLNVLITKPASKGYEDRPTLILQSHTDMVCEKNESSTHNFALDPIKYVIEDGWMIAKETTLGADCGIGVATAMAALVDERPKGRLECLFTSSEETGMDGAFGLKEGFITGKTLINLDSEDEGELFVGCAGGMDTTAKFGYKKTEICDSAKIYKLKIFNGVGGHSGDDINKERANAVQLLARFLYSQIDKISICEIDGGNKRNAIARQAWAKVAICEGIDSFLTDWERFSSDVKAEFAISEPNLSFEIQESNAEFCFDDDTSYKLIRALFSAPHGVLAMSLDIPGLVETSTNLASVKMLEGNIVRIGTSQRSSVQSARRAAAAKVEASFVQAGAVVTHEGEYPGWKPNMNSYILAVCKDAYKNRFGYNPKVKAIHAGLECGLFLEKFPDLDMISFGPTLRGVHAPGEKLELASLDKFVVFLDDVIKCVLG